MKYYVCRIRPFPNCNRIVAIYHDDGNGHPCNSPDLLVERYAGEGVNYEDRQSAILAAQAIANNWANDEDGSIVEIEHMDE